MTWTPERKYEAAVRGPLARGYAHHDTRFVERAGWFQVITPSATGFLNEIAFSQVDAADAERTIDETAAAYREIGQLLKWSVGPWTKPEDFGERLQRRGCFGWEMRGMGIDTASELGASPDVRIVAVDDSNVDEFVRAVMVGWSMPAEQFEVLRNAHASSLVAEPRTMFYFAAVVDGQWVGTASVIMHDDFGYIFLIQVLEEVRGRGAFRALVAANLAFLRQRGFGYAVTHAREATSAPMFEHLGFETLFRSTSFMLMP